MISLRFPSLLAVGLMLLAPASVLRGGLAGLPANTWVALEPVVVQPAADMEKGQWRNVGWNKLVYDAAGKRILYYDRWIDKKHGGLTIYGNCLFAFDPASARLTPLGIDNWQKKATKQGGYRTLPLPENDRAPTPCSRHVYHAFDYVPELKSVFLCNGANQGAVLEEKLLGHKLTADTWRFDLEKKAWRKVESKVHPPNFLEDGMAWHPETKSIVYAGHGKIWILDVASGQWRKAKTDLPRLHMGMTVFYDPPRKRLLLAGGGTYGKWKTKAGGFNALYAFDPRTEVVSKLADCPTALCRAALAYDSKRDRFVTAVRFEGAGGEQPSGMFAYNPKKDAWEEIKPVNAVPMKNGWMPLCYDSANDCLIGLAGQSFYAFRHDPASAGRPSALPTIQSPLAEKWDYKPAMKRVAARFKGKEGVVIHVGASDTIANPYTTWARMGKGKTPEDEAVLKWMHTDAKNKTDGWWLCRTELVSHRASTAESGLRSSMLFDGGALGLPPLAKMLEDYKPRIVVLEVGIYEVEDRRPLADYRKNMARALDQILKQGAIPIPTTEPPVRAQLQTSKAYNETLRELARERNLPLIDLEQEILQRRPDDWYGTLMTRMHLTASRAGVTPASAPTVANLRESGFLLRGWLTVRKLAEVKRRVLDGKDKP